MMIAPAPECDAAVVRANDGLVERGGILAKPHPILLVALAAGLILRFLLRGHTTPDTELFSLPWYAFAKAHRFAGLRQAFTNYTPFYSYLLIGSTYFEPLGRPLSLIKAISGVFELGCALVVAEAVWHVTRSARRAALAFTGVWLAPTVLFNGAAWGQADAIWTFFALLAVSSFMRGRNGALPFAFAVAVKAQAVFLAPFMLGMILRRRLHWGWLIAVPAIYVGLAAPVLASGRPLVSVLAIYLEQADYYHDLYKGAANAWLFAGPTLPYEVGLVAGLLLAAGAGLAIAVRIGQADRDGPVFIVLTACVSLLAMPFLLPKMHDRFFYGFELAAILLACLEARYLAVAAIAQLDGVLAYLAFDFHITLGVPVAALCNAALFVFLLAELYGNRRESRPDVRAWVSFALSGAALLGALAAIAAAWPGAILAYVAAASAVVGTAITLLREARKGFAARSETTAEALLPAKGALATD